MTDGCRRDSGRERDRRRSKRGVQPSSLKDDGPEARERPVRAPPATDPPAPNLAETPRPILGRTVTETGRLETFADGVFAIAITLLVLAIRLPAPNEDLVEALRRQWPEFAAYFVSFLTIGIMWVQHHRLFTLIRRSNTTFAMINVVFLMFIAFVPVPDRGARPAPGQRHPTRSRRRCCTAAP